jgi:hypothetical protein
MLGGSRRNALIHDESAGYQASGRRFRLRLRLAVKRKRLNRRQEVALNLENADLSRVGQRFSSFGPQK